MKSIRVTKLVNFVHNWVVTRICDVDMEKVQKYKKYPSTNFRNRTSIRACKPSIQIYSYS